MTIDLSDKYKPFFKQFLAHIAPYEIVLYGGAMYSGKTRWLCADIIRRAIDYPGSQAAIIRRNMPSLKRSTLRTFLQLIDDRIIRRFNQQDMYIEFKNGSIVFFMEANEQKDPEFFKFGGVELSFLGIDEAQEVSEKALLALLPKLRHLPRGYKHREDLPPNFFRVNLTANPAPGWVKEKFVDNPVTENSIYIAATVFDHPYAPKGWLEKQKKIFGGNEVLWRRFILGDWSVVYDESAWLLFDPKWIEESLVDEDDEQEGDNDIWLGIDIARVRDKTVIAKMRGNRLIGFETYMNVRADDIINIIKRKINDDGVLPGHIAIDAIGIGASIIDMLEGEGYEVLRFFAGRKPLDTGEIREKLGAENEIEFANLRAQAFWMLSRSFQNGEIEIVKTIDELDFLKNELLAIKYKGERRIQIEDKEKIRSALGRSPDYLDAFVMAYFAKYLSNEIKSLVVL